MNRLKRRSLKQNAVDALKLSKSFILVVQNDDGGPVYYGDVSKLNNPNDVRHDFMHTIFDEVVTGAKAVNDHAVRRVHDIEQKDAVESAKEKRSEELSKFSED